MYIPCCLLLQLKMKLFLVLLAVTAASAYTFDFYEDYFTEAFVNYHNARSDVTWKV